MRLPEPIERSLEDGPEQLPEQEENPWGPIGDNAGLGLSVVDVEYGYVPPWHEGLYRQDVPK